jgi:putative transposase
MCIRDSYIGRGGRTEKKERYTDEQIACALKQAEAGTSVADICCKMCSQ